MRLYEKYPEISSLESKILEKSYKNKITRLKIERSILIPKNDILLDDSLDVSGREIISIREDKDRQIIDLKGKVNSKNVILNVDKDLRYKNLYHTTAYLLFKIFLKDFYGTYETELRIKDSTIRVRDFDKDLDIGLIEELINHAIGSDLPIKRTDNRCEVLGLSSCDSPYISFDKTYKIRSFKLKECIRDGKDLDIKIQVGPYWQNSLKC